MAKRRDKTKVNNVFLFYFTNKMAKMLQEDEELDRVLTDFVEDFNDPGLMGGGGKAFIRGGIVNADKSVPG